MDGHHCVVYLLLLLGSGDFQVWGLIVTGKDVPTEALRGEDVTIPCLLSGVPIPLNLEKVSVVWTQILLNGTEHEVYRFRGSHHQSWRPGSYMNDSDIQQGNASLYIPDIQITDEGNYRCFAIVTPDEGSHTSILYVSVKPQATLSNKELLESGYLTINVYCKVSEFYPEAVDIQWVKHSIKNGTNSSLNEEAYLTIPLNRNGIFNVTSLLPVKQFRETEPGDKLFCIVNHRSLKEDITLSFTLPRWNPFFYVFYASTVFNFLQFFAAFLIIIFRKGLGRWIFVFANAFHIVQTILACFVLHYSKDIHGVNIKRMYIGIFLGIFFLLLSWIFQEMLWRYWKKGKITVSGISGDRCIPHMKRTTLTCQITHFKPKEIQINVYLKRRNKKKKHLIASWKSTDQTSSMAGGQEENNSVTPPLLEEGAEHRPLLPVEMKVEMTKSRTGMYSCLCSITITPNKDTDDMAQLEVEVEHPSLKLPISVYRTLSVYKGDKPSLCRRWRRWRRQTMHVYDRFKTAIVESLAE